MALDTLTETLIEYANKWRSIGNDNKKLSRYSDSWTYVYECKITERQVGDFVISISSDTEAPKVVEFFRNLQEISFSFGERYNSADLVNTNEEIIKMRHCISDFIFHIYDLIGAKNADQEECSVVGNEYAVFCKRNVKNYEGPTTGKMVPKDALAETLKAYTDLMLLVGEANREPLVDSYSPHMHICVVAERRVEDFVVSISSDAEVPKIQTFFQDLSEISFFIGAARDLDNDESMREEILKKNSLLSEFTSYIYDLIDVKTPSNVSSKPVDEYAEFCKRYAKK